jgi:phage terminase large subunit-like protein
VLNDSFDPFKPSHVAALRQDELPAEAPIDGSRPLLRDRWTRLLTLQREYREDTDERLRRLVAREFRDVVHDVAGARRAPDTAYEFVTSVIGMHPRSSRAKLRRGGGRRFGRFCSEFLVHTKGRWAGQALVLERWQQREADAVFLVDTVTGLRVIQEAYVQEPKKNGKSTRASAVAGYLLLADDEPGAEVYGGAKDKDQARIVFGQLVAMLRESSLDNYVRYFKDAIEVPSTGGFYKVIAADAMSDEGVNMHGGVVDELHHHESPDLYDMLSRSGDAREQPLLYGITNAPAEEDPESSVCSRVRAMGLAVLRRDKDARTDMYASIDEVKDDELEDRRAWMRVNKASWITVEVIERSRRKSRPVDVMRYRFNRPASDDEAGFLPPGAWEALTAKLALGEQPRAWLAVDFAQRKDTASVAWVVERSGWVDGEAGRWLCGGYVWGVQPLSIEKQPPPCHLLLPADEKITHALVENHLRDQAVRLDLAAVAFDPWRFSQSAELLEDEGAPMIEYPQSNERTAPATEHLFDAIIDRQLLHAGDEVLAQHMKNAATRDVGRGYRLDKTKGRRAMDFATALMMALDMAVNQEPARVSAYEERGLSVV